ncbi:MAG: HEPN/Toprim-associated domain-containing protein [Bryobacterales bacterium]|nr:HEPN/Toprim-associated domain-containing protein [Bryobacterales bacterium]
MILLSVGHLEIDWNRNNFSSDHSQLFQPSDLSTVPYYYADPRQPYRDDEGAFNLVTTHKEGLSKPLHQVLERVNLLGHTLEAARHEYESAASLHGIDPEKLSFDQLAKALATVDVASISPDYGDGQDFGKFFRRCIFDKIALATIVDDPDYVQYSTGACLEQLSACTILQLIAQNASACTLSLTWQFADEETEKWATRDQFVRPVDRENRFLIVTEGSSDAHVLRHAFGLLKPHIADFFDFVDMDKGYPFTGTGNLYNFTKGLVSISILNNIVVLYDNDAEGVYNFNRTLDLELPENMRVLKLPSLPEFRTFHTLGPTGEHRADINERAAAIECYLDIGPSARVRWTSFNKGSGTYHGVLVDKEHTLKTFLSKSSVDGRYDFSKITRVLDLIVSECVAMRELA